MSAVERSRKAAPALPTGAPAPELDIRDISHETVDALVARGTAYSREYVRVQDSATTLKKNVAVVCLALRRQMGDLAGDSYEYRRRVSDMYEAANIPDDLKESIRSGVRYHIGNLMRDVYTPDELASLHLLKSKPVDRMREQATRTRALVTAIQVQETSRKKKPPRAAEAKPSAASEKGLAVKATADQLRLAEAARRVVDQVDEEVVRDSMTPGQRQKLDDNLAAMESRIRSLRRKLKRMGDGT
ncbi:hypothetical protein ADL27_38445 [Streptomyces sp. NRRL F-6602]|nr:hypothetical protein ADL27_38445 [Streptomyces sp. NRRL F-6602]